MARDFFTMDDFDLAGRTVLVRVDINSPIDPATGRLLSDARIREHAATLWDLRDAKVAVLAHQSRPGKDDFTALEVHADHLSSILGIPVRYVDSLYGRHAIEAVRGLKEGEVVLLENTRFYAEEEALADAKVEKMARSHMVQRLAPLADAFVLDAFAAAHRAQPSLVGFSEVLPTLAGRVMERELVNVTRALESQERPKIAIFGGIKVDDSLDIAEHMLDRGIVDRVLTTGGVAHLFLHAKGLDPGAPTVSFLENQVAGYADLVPRARTLLKAHGDRILVPADVVLNDRGRRRPVRTSELPATLPIVDIGLDTIAHYADEVGRAKTIIMNGPAGVFEIEEFSVGTRELFTAVAEADAFTVVGGGHTVAAVERLGLANGIDHVSTGGGALISFLAGKELPLVTALRRSREKFPRAGRDSRRVK
ncbi:MAG TPA: phosphoglycerate kinase [Thermoplasmata archaeon]|nr:phosphoglycerate kinase [Thermoplasmata archaeon]